MQTTNSGLMDVAERFLQWTFADKNQLQLALTAGGAVTECHEGNRTLAHVGDSALGLSMSKKAFRERTSRGATAGVSLERHANLCVASLSNEKSFVLSAKQRGTVATATGINTCIQYSPRSGKNSDKVKGLAISALIAVVYLETDDLGQVDKFVDHLW